MLVAGDVSAHLVRRGIIPKEAEVEVVELTGGVSAAIFAARTGSTRVVVKRALPQFRVADEWLVPTERSLFEAQALELVAELAPGSAPRLLDVDAETHTLVVEGAPPSWRSWKAMLLEGAADRSVARRLGEVLRRLHAGTRDLDLGSAESFEAQRVDPYLRTIQRRHPAHAEAIGAYVDRLLATRRCVVHGDFSPKNVLAGNGGLWVIDWEIVHRGDPAFDVAFLLNHLALKSVHRPQSREAYEACADAFLSAYGTRDVDTRYVLGLLGCLMLARVDGKSPAEYLTDAGRGRARSAGISLLSDPPAEWSEVFALVRPDPPR